MSQISILIPTHEPDPAHLRAALDSVFRQTLQDFSVIIHDDASRTDVEKIIGPYKASDRCVFVRSDKRLGIAANWNACLKLTKSPFVQYLFQDDIWHEGYLEHAHKAMKPEIGLVATAHKYQVEGTMRFDKDLNAWYRDVEKKRANIKSGAHVGRLFLCDWLKQKLHPNLIGEPSFVMIRRELFAASGLFDDRFPQGLDSEMWTRLLQLTNVSFVHNDGGFFRVHSKGASALNRELGAGLLDRLSTIERLCKNKDSIIKKEAKAAFRASLSEMFYKAKGRKTLKAPLPFKEKVRFLKLAAKHPLLTARGLSKR